MERIVQRPGALDVHKASVTACVRIWHGKRLEELVHEFPTTVRGLLALADWLQAHQVEQVVMEATGVYWKPVWAILEDRFALMRGRPTFCVSAWWDGNSYSGAVKW
jgi:transposase